MKSNPRLAIILALPRVAPLLKTQTKLIPYCMPVEDRRSVFGKVTVNHKDMALRLAMVPQLIFNDVCRVHK